MSVCVPIRCCLSWSLPWTDTSSSELREEFSPLLSLALGFLFPLTLIHNQTLLRSEGVSRFVINSTGSTSAQLACKGRDGHKLHEVLGHAYLSIGECAQNSFVPPIHHPHFRTHLRFIALLFSLISFRLFCSHESKSQTGSGLSWHLGECFAHTSMPMHLQPDLSIRSSTCHSSGKLTQYSPNAPPPGPAIPVVANAPLSDISQHHLSHPNSSANAPPFADPAELSAILSGVPHRILFNPPQSWFAASCYTGNISWAYTNNNARLSQILWCEPMGD